MIIGGSKKEVIRNIQKKVINNELNSKVELDDPILTDEEREKLLKRFYGIRKHKLLYFLESRIAYLFVDLLAIKLNSSIQIEGLENIKDISSGAIITSNHFNPLDNMAIRKLIKKSYKKNVYIVSQETNLAMKGFLGYLMNSLNILPIFKGPNYIINTFKPELKKILDKKNYILIYPEEEMWFNYKKPRPCKRGAYQFACEANVPIISCFIEIQDTNIKDNDEFNEVKYIVHVLKPIYKDESKSIKENSKLLAIKDYNQKKEAYEKYYNKKLNYEFDYDDIAGYIER